MVKTEWVEVKGRNERKKVCFKREMREEYIY